MDQRESWCLIDRTRRGRRCWVQAPASRARGDSFLEYQFWTATKASANRTILAEMATCAHSRKPGQGRHTIPLLRGRSCPEWSPVKLLWPLAKNASNAWGPLLYAALQAFACSKTLSSA